MKLSVIVPVYNGQDYLRAALDSIAAQTLGDFECIMVDDGSTDDSRAIISEYARRDSRFKPVFQENAGVSAARNAGIDAAGGEYIAFMDQDDLMNPRAMELLYKAAEKYDADMVFGNSVAVENDFSSAPVVGLSGIKIFTHPQKDFTRKISKIKKSNWVYVWTKIFRRDVVGPLRFAPGLQPCEDTDFVLKSVPLCAAIVYADVPVVYWRKSATGFSHNGGRKTAKGIHAAVCALLSIDAAISENPDWEKEYKNFARAGREYTCVKWLLNAEGLENDFVKSELARLRNYRMRTLSMHKKIEWILFKLKWRYK
ncbi:MAG: glycosyltransferase [Rickettsiales bacterium]|jgi:glycosyltransferase involved in cell wall biosynthesis|nr:glycosyltransferase [Rickettsiales bacterium]